MTKLLLIIAVCAFLVFDPTAVEILGSDEGIRDALGALLIALLGYRWVTSALEV